MTKDEALLMALEAMESVTVECNNFHHPKKDQNHHWAKCPPIVRWDKAITAIKEALAQHDSVQAKPEPEQEPFAYVNVEKRRLEFAHDYVKWDTPTTIKLDKIPLYTTPPQRTWVGLTDEEIDVIDEATWDEDHKSWGIHDFARAIEAKLKEKNT